MGKKARARNNALHDAGHTDAGGCMIKLRRLVLRRLRDGLREMKQSEQLRKREGMADRGRNVAGRRYCGCDAMGTERTKVLRRLRSPGIRVCCAGNPLRGGRTCRIYRTLRQVGNRSRMVAILADCRVDHGCRDNHRQKQHYEECPELHSETSYGNFFH